MTAGRPRTSTPPPEEMILLGEEMVAWVKKNKPLHLSHWWSIEKFIIQKVWDTMSVAPEFLPYYELALKIVGQQYLDKRSNVRDSISHRWQRVYFKDLRNSEDADFDAEAARKASSLKNEAKAIEEERQKVLEEVARNRKSPS
jgi:hypothetical protein